ncbi:hypothetical protein KGM_207108 [Danaus plexippus plexippus]|uniref:Selenoprotein O n=1 Tax=Danaus plexippus plexippus TaxID=278856 RepID=A0A212FMZ4_DANPL|nr:hypothetical protein KGM_207108 [Danaus plexippus plexippus]
MAKPISDFKEWKFRLPPSYVQLPITGYPDYNIPRAVKDAVFVKVPTEPLTGKIDLVCVSNDALTDILDLDPVVAESEEFVEFINGKYLPQGALSVCHGYGGYQFGFWADQLGDGRAHILGEYVNSKGELWQLQLKGSGETPFSRFGDGRAVLRSSLREMVASEACHHLGIPTTRAAGLVASDSHKVLRDRSYSGLARPERAAVLLRLAPSWMRIGSFELMHRRQQTDMLVELADHVIKHFFSHIDLNDKDKYVKFFTEVAHKNLDMVATWQGLGFTHGVLNTDNISILGLTIDYGPFGFIEHYYENYVPNSSDDMGRYAFNKQPEILLWNLGKLAEALQLILCDESKKKIKDVIDTLELYVKDKILHTYILKLGLTEVRKGDDKLVKDFLEMMQQTSSDFTGSFRQISEISLNQLLDKETLESKWALARLSKSKNWDKWIQRYKDRCCQENVNEDERVKHMLKVNPLYVPRNWMLQEAIKDAENNDFNKVRLLLEIFTKPYEANEEAEKLGYSSQPPSWSFGLKLSCSS